MNPLPVSLQALAIQFAAALIALAAEWLIQSLLHTAPSVWRWGCLQAIAATVIARRTRQPSWWQLLHAAFVPAVLAAHTLALPPSLYLVAFGVVLLTFWGVARTRVPLYLSDEKAWRALLPLLPAREFRFVDLGSGLGGVPLWLERQRPDGHYTGVELAPLPWLVSWLRARLTGSRARFVRADYSTLDLGQFDVVFAFLSPAAMPALWARAQAEMSPGSRFVSLSFDAPGRAPDMKIWLADGERHQLYGWQM